MRDKKRGPGGQNAGFRCGINGGSNVGRMRAKTGLVSGREMRDVLEVTAVDIAPMHA